MTSSDDPFPVDVAGVVARYEAVIAELRAANAVLVARVAELERQIGLDSSNSGKPPSGDGLKKKSVRIRSLRERSGKKRGGQKGHPGKTLNPVEIPDITINHFPPTCDGCGAALSEAMATDHSARQVFDLPDPQPLVVTEHRAHQCQCIACGTRTRAAFPAGVSAPVQYGTRIAAFVVYLLHYQLLPEKRLAALMTDLFDVTLATATIARMSRSCATRFVGFVTTVRDCVAAAPVKHLDETGFRIGGKTQWLHIASTILLTFYRISPQRGSMPENLSGTVVHDHWKPYFKLKDVLHALCNAHHLRELKALIELEKEDWAGRMQRLLRRACHAANLAREQGRPLSPHFVARTRRCYDMILARGFTFHEGQQALGPQVAAATDGHAKKRRGRKPRRVGHNLLIRFQTRREDVLRFLSDPAVPFTNNVAEQDARMMKVRQKVSGGFRSTKGATDFGTIRSLLSTTRKQGWDILRTLQASPEILAARLLRG